MPSRCIFPLVVLLFVGCGKDDPVPPRVVIPDDREPKVQAVPAKQKTVEAPPTPAPPKKEERRADLVPFDLRNYGIFAVIDAPPGAKIQQKGVIEISGGDGYSLSLKPDSFDLAKIKRDLISAPKASALIDTADALLVQYLDGAEPRFSFYVNVKVAGKPYQIGKTNDRSATLEQIRRNVEAARSLRQTPDLKKAMEEHDNAETLLRAIGATIEVVEDGGNSRQIVFAPNRQLQDKHLVQLSKLPELSEVDLCVNDKLTLAGFDHVLVLPRLTRLAVGGAWVNPEIVSRIGDMSNLRVLRIINAPMTNDMLRSLANLTNLTELYLDGARIGDYGLNGIQGLKKLKYLHLTGTDVTDKGMAHLKNLEELRELSLSDTAITDAALEKLAALPALMRLDLSDTAVTDAGLEFLLKTLRRLEINLTGTNVSAAGIAKMKMAAGAFTLKQPWPINEPDPAKVAPHLWMGKAPAVDPAAFVDKLGGKLKQDDGKQIIAIDLHGKKVTDGDLWQFSSLTKLQSLNLDGCTSITDAGLHYLSGLTDLEELNLNGANIRGDGLGYLKGLTKLTRLSLHAPSAFTSQQLSPLANLPNLEVIALRFPQDDYPVLALISQMTKLKELNLENLRLTNRKMEYLKGLKNLESLDWAAKDNFPIGAWKCLKEMTGLKTLVMRNYKGSNAGLMRMGTFANLKASLKTLEIGGPLISDNGIAALNSLDNLERLRLEGPNIGDGALKSLPNREHLLELSVVGTGITDSGLSSLARGEIAALGEMEVLDLSFTSVTDDGFCKLKDLPELRDLRLNGTKIDGHGFKALADLPRLRHLQVNGTKVDDAGAAAISQLASLVSLDLGRTPITDAAIDHFLKLRTLDELRLDECENLTNNAVSSLKKIPALKRVSLTGTRISIQPIDELRKAGVNVEFKGIPLP